MQHTEIIIDQRYPGLNPRQFGYEKCAPGHFYGPAVRTHWLLHFVVSGRGIFQRGGVTHRLAAGSIFVIPPYEETYYEADAEQPWTYIWVGFSTEFDVKELLVEPVIRCPGAGMVFEEMKYCRHLESGRSAYLSGKLWELISLLQERSNTEIGYVDKAVHCMHSEYMSGITVQEIASRLNLDRCYFSTLFKTQMGIPPMQYLIRLRMEKAAELMREHGERPSTAGASVGYPDLYHFSKVFKGYFGLSPRAYLEKNQKVRR